MKLKQLIKHLQIKPNQDAEVEYVIYEKESGNLVTVDVSGASTQDLMRVLTKRKPLPTSTDSSDDSDELYNEAVKAVLSARCASTSIIQRRLRIGYNRASRLMGLMEKRGVVGPENAASPREILIPVR